MLSRTQVLLRYKRFKEGRDYVNDDARLQPIKTLKQLRKLFWIIVESLLKRLQLMMAYRLAQAAKIAKF